MARRITVLLTAQEYEQVCTKAGLVPLSRWFRSLALNGAEPPMAVNTSLQGDSKSESAEKVAESTRSALPGLGSDAPELHSDAVVEIPPAPIESKLVTKRVGKGKTCEHGTKTGFRCWQCGGIAKIP